MSSFCAHSSLCIAGNSVSLSDRVAEMSTNHSASSMHRFPRRRVHVIAGGSSHPDFCRRIDLCDLEVGHVDGSGGTLSLLIGAQRLRRQNVRSGPLPTECWHHAARRKPHSLLFGAACARGRWTQICNNIGIRDRYCVQIDFYIWDPYHVAAAVK